MSASPVVVLVHGAWGGSWVWEDVRARLAREGIRSLAVDLPSVGEDAARLGDMHQDAAAVRSAVDAVDGPVVLLGHSYGGVPVTEGAAGARNVVRLVYLAAFMLDEGESLLGSVGGRPPAWWHELPDGTVTTDDPVPIAYNECDPEVARAAAARRRPHRRLAFEQTLRAAAWHDVPSTYVVCERDNAIPVFAQEAMAQRASRVVRLDADHSPHLSRPDAFVATVVEAHRAAGA